MVRRLLVLAFLPGLAAPALAAFDAAPRRAVDLSGYWVLNAALSDDAEKMLDERLEEERRRYTRERRIEERAQPEGVPPLEPEAAPPPTRTLRPWQKRRLENFRRMLGATETLDITQQGASLTLVSGVDSRRLTAGSRTQVSMPEGELADSSVGWDGETFVIDRKVRRGPRIVEKLRLLKSGQLEYALAIGGDSELAGLKVRRVFDRGSAPVNAPDPNAGPVR